jgi:hypothetical protein
VVSDWSQSWTVIGVPSARIARTELDDSPFGGRYDLMLNVGPEVRLDRIQRVQLLVNASYWVKQQ